MKALQLAALLGLIPLTTPAAVAAEVPGATQPAPVDPAHRVAAQRLAQTVQPRAVAVDESIRSLDKQIVSALLANPDVREMEKAAPGVVQAMWNGAKPMLEEALVAKLPELWNLIANIYARRLTPKQLASAQDFYGSDVGQKFVLVMARSVDYGTMLEDVIKNPDADISQGAYRSSVASAASKAAASLTPAERALANKYLLSSEGRAFVALAPEVSTAGVAWMNKPDPELDARVEQAMAKAVERHLAKAGK